MVVNSLIHLIPIVQQQSRPAGSTFVILLLSDVRPALYWDKRAESDAEWCFRNQWHTRSNCRCVPFHKFFVKLYHKFHRDSSGETVWFILLCHRDSSGETAFVLFWCITM